MSQKIFTASEFIDRLKWVESFPTVYMWGSFGQVVSEAFIQEKARQYPWWYTASKIRYLRTFIGKAFAKDCVGLAKSLAWGWKADWNHPRGGVRYGINGVSDQTSTTMFNRSTNISTDFTTIKPGEAVHMIGHIGFYIGNSKVIEATPIWQDGVQITYLGQRNWLRHGELYFVDYSRRPEWQEIIFTKMSSPQMWLDFAKEIEKDSLGRWFPDFVIKLNESDGQNWRGRNWEEIIHGKMSASREWVNFIRRFTNHPTARFLPIFVEKLAV